MLLEKLKKDALEARKARDTLKASLLTTLVAEAERVGKDDGNRLSSDTEVVAVIKKFIKNADESLRALQSRSDPGGAAVSQVQTEKSVLECYLPSQASEAQIREQVERLVGVLDERSPKQMGALMAKLNSAFEGNFDKALASRIVKEALAG